MEPGSLRWEWESAAEKTKAAQDEIDPGSLPSAQYTASPAKVQGMRCKSGEVVSS